MKNNKGMVLSIYIYILLVFFLLILSTMLLVLNNTKLLATKMKNGISTELNTTASDFSIVLKGNLNFYVAKGFSYVEPGYTAQTNGGSSITATITSNVNTSVLGNYTCVYEAVYNGVKKSITRNVIVVESAYSFNYTGSAQTFVAPASGYYKLEVWGAQGGAAYTPYVGGYGGYSTGVVYLKENEIIYIYVGQAGTGGNANGYPAAYNGGAEAYGGAGDTSRYGGAGGGATHIATVVGLLSTLSSNSSSILIVAGGGGGASYMASNNCGNGGSGGGYIAQTATFTSAGSKYNVPSTGGTQVVGGNNGYGWSPVTGTGSFGLGSNNTAGDGGGGAGGGGFYGGGAGQYVPGAGGSGYIANPSLLTYGGVTKSMYCYSCTTSSTSSILTYSTTNVSATATTNYAKSGNGYAKIAYVGLDEPTRTNTKLNNVRYIKDCMNGNSVNTANHWVEIKAIYEGINVAKNKTVTGTVTENTTYPYSRIVDGDTTANNWSTGSSSTGLKCVTVDLTKEYDLSTITIWHYYTDSRIYYSNTTYVSSDNVTWTPVIANANPETISGKSVTAYESNTTVVPIYRVSNLLVDPSFSSGNTNWANYGSTSSFSSGVASVTATIQYGGIQQSFSSAIIDSIKGHKVYGSSMFKADTISAYWIAVNDGYLQSEPKLSQINVWERLSGIQTFNSSATAGYVKTQDARTSSWTLHYVKEPMLIDLTATFGAGNEPTKAWCDSNLSYFAGTQNMYLSP